MSRVGSSIQKLAPCVFVHWLWRRHQDCWRIWSESMLLKCYEHLHHISRTSSISQSTQIDHDVGCALDIFEMPGSSSEPTKECVNRELLSWKTVSFAVVEQTWIHVSNCRSTCASNFGHCRISIWNRKKSCSHVGILIILCQCMLQTDNLERLIFVNKKWRNDSRHDYNAPKNMTQLIDLEPVLSKGWKKNLKVFWNVRTSLIDARCSWVRHMWHFFGWS